MTPDTEDKVEQRNLRPACGWCKKTIAFGAIMHRFVGQPGWFCCEAHARMALDQSEGKPV